MIPSRRFALLRIAALAALAAGAPVAAKRRPHDESTRLNATLARCLRATPARPLRPAGRPAAAPGISGTVRAYRLAGANGPAIVYIGDDPKILRCGVALYGPVTNESVQAMLGLIAKVPRLRRQSPDVAPPVANPRWPSADLIAWGDPLGPMERGVTMAIRKPSPGLPTLEVESHSRIAW